MFPFPFDCKGNLQVFIGGVGTGNQWRMWQKPTDCKVVHIWCLGAGGGGGAGLTGISSANRGGGAGGGSGALVQWLVPAWLLPDILHIYVGNGGLGGTTSAAAGGAGQRSYVCITPSLTATNVFLVSGAADAGGGAGGTTAAATAGTAGTIATSSTGILTGMGLWTARVGQAGAAGGTGAGTGGGAGGNVSALGVCCVTGGAGGGGCGTNGTTNNAGGNITGVTINNQQIVPTVTGGGANTNGPSGWTQNYPFLALGGAGGGSAAGSGVGGTGGSGGIGCGGAGGGGGITFGPGGNGGPGMVVILSW